MLTLMKMNYSIIKGTYLLVYDILYVYYYVYFYFIIFLF